ncbi:MAG TPA: ABC transporter permease [Actinophytocola sp.]|nr:ABC transporter permease [Actinophytocola sp.]
MTATATLPPKATPVKLARRRRKIRLMPWLPLAVLGIVLIAAIFAPWLTDHDPLRSDLANSLEPPAWQEDGSSTYLLGTDGFGRDVLTRLIYGARISVSVAALSLLIAVVIGSVIGVTAGYLGGWIDSVLMRLVDILLAFPTILVALVVSVAVGPSFQNLVLVLGVLNSPRIARIVRGETLMLKGNDYARYSAAIGVPRRVIVRRHIFPNVLPTLTVATTLEVGQVILAEASLSFLGAGLPPPTASWGVMISEGRALIATGWWVALFPGIAITITVLACNSLGDWLRDHLDPKTRQV